MKTVKLISKIALIIFALNTPTVYALRQGEVKEKFDKSFKLNSNGTLNFGVYDSDLKVNVWKNNEVKLVGEIIVEGGKDEDKKLLIEAFKNPEVDASESSIEINTEFWRNMNSNGFTSRVTLKNGEKIVVDKFKANYTLWIPESIIFELNSKYNNVSMADFSGVMRFELYDVDITAGNFADNSYFDAKYSTLILGNGGNSTFNIYDCKVRTQNLKNFKIESKYSNYAIASAFDVKINSYDDDFEIKNLKSIEAKASYSLFILNGELGNSVFDLYDSDVKGGNYNTLNYSAKYSELAVGKVSTLTISSIYDCTLRIDEVTDFSCDDSKYDEIYIGITGNSFIMPNTYDTQIKINKLMPSFTRFEGDFKYGTVRLYADPQLNYKLTYDGTYGSIDYPKERFSSSPLTHIEKDSKVKLEGSTSPNPKCTIKFKSYDLKFSIE